jgi:hypothetical protein
MKEKEEGRPDYNRAKMDPAESQADQRVDWHGSSKVLE